MSAFLYEQVAAQLSAQIEQGTYGPGDRLPGLRRLRQHYGVSMATMVAACELLEQQGVLTARPRSGFYVAEATIESPGLPEVTAAADGPALVTGQERVLELVQLHNDPSLVPLGAAVPDSQFLPLTALDRCFARVRRQHRRRVATYDFPPGAQELRIQVARLMAGAGCQTAPDEIVITSGCQEAMALSLRAVAEPGDIVAIESPTFYGILQAIESQGMQAMEIATDPQEGMIPSALHRALNDWNIRACVMMPSFGNPLGHLATDARKAELVGMLTERGVALIENDVYGELGYGGARPWAAKAFDTAGEVLYCSSFSKTLSPGLRVGWCAAGRYRDRVAYMKYASSQASASQMTLAVADYLERGGYERHLRGMQRRSEQQVKRVTAAVRRYFPAGTRATRPRGGFVVWVVLPQGCEAFSLQQKALAAGISIAPGPIFSPTGRYANCLRLNCAQPWAPRLDEAIATVGRLARQQLASGHAGQPIR